MNQEKTVMYRGKATESPRGNSTKAHLILIHGLELVNAYSQVSRWYVSADLYIILNLGMSKNFGSFDWDDLGKLWDEYGSFKMLVDWVRVYQDEDKISDDSISCNPRDFPTKEYIERHMPAYTNPNLTVWGKEKGGYQAEWPRNRLYANGKGCEAKRIGKPGDPSLSSPYYKPAKTTPSSAVGKES